MKGWQKAPFYLFLDLVFLGTPLVAEATELSITCDQSLSFGVFAAPSSGTVTVSHSGLRSKEGGVVLLLQAGNYSEARCLVSGDPGTEYFISLPGDQDVKLWSGNLSLSLHNWQSFPAGMASLSGAIQTVRIGASLDVDSSSRSAHYNGTFTINFEVP